MRFDTLSQLYNRKKESERRGKGVCKRYERYHDDETSAAAAAAVTDAKVEEVLKCEL